MSPKWYVFREIGGSRQKLPPVKRYVLVAYSREALGAGMPPAVAVGYLKFAAGDKNCPNFIVPGVGGKPDLWSDCLGDDFECPHWAGKQEPTSHQSLKPQHLEWIDGRWQEAEWFNGAWVPVGAIAREEQRKLTEYPLKNP